MVKAAIFQADTPIAGELIRILINHPEVELKKLYAPAHAGINVANFHHGLIGEIPLKFSDNLIEDSFDLVLITDTSDQNLELLKNLKRDSQLKIIALGKNIFTDADFPDSQIGVSEINRKALVRGAEIAYIPSPVVVVALIALIPLANFLLLNSDIDIAVNLPEDILKKMNLAEDTLELINQIKLRQASFNANINLEVSQTSSPRAMSMVINLKNSLSIEEIENIYNGIYDDHNFSFVSSFPVSSKEVEGTQKTVMYMEKPQPDSLKISISVDPRMRGGAGDLVHILNLFFGLHEKTGLTLKSSVF